MGPVKEAGPADLKACLACCCLHGCWDIAPSQRPSLPPSILGLWWPLTPQPLRSSLCMRQSEDCETCPRQEPRAKAGAELSQSYSPRGGRTWATPRLPAPPHPPHPRPPRPLPHDQGSLGKRSSGLSPGAQSWCTRIFLTLDPAYTSWWGHGRTDNPWSSEAGGTGEFLH